MSEQEGKVRLKNKNGDDEAASASPLSLAPGQSKAESRPTIGVVNSFSSVTHVLARRGDSQPSRSKQMPEGHGVGTTDDADDTRVRVVSDGAVTEPMTTFAGEVGEEVRTGSDTCSQDVAERCADGDANPTVVGASRNVAALGGPVKASSEVDCSLNASNFSSSSEVEGKQMPFKREKRDTDCWPDKTLQQNVTVAHWVISRMGLLEKVITDRSTHATPS